jgi:hypothetical protein
MKKNWLMWVLVGVAIWFLFFRNGGMMNGTATNGTTTASE